MNEDAQAALLKTLEEPAPGVVARAVRRWRGRPAADHPLALRPASGSGRSGSATSRRSSSRTARPTRRPRRGSPGSPTVGRGWPWPGRPTRRRSSSATSWAGPSSTCSTADRPSACAASGRRPAAATRLAAIGEAPAGRVPSPRRAARRPTDQGRARRRPDGDDAAADGGRRRRRRGRGRAHAGQRAPAGRRGARRPVDGPHPRPGPVPASVWPVDVRDLALLDDTSAAAARLDPADLDRLPRPARTGRRLPARQRLAGARPRRPGHRLAAPATPARRRPAPDVRARPRLVTDPATDLVRLEATVIGRVQGVGFRYHVLRRAMDLGLDRVGRQRARRLGALPGRGTARGPRDAAREALEIGPAGAIVERVVAAWGPATGDARAVRRPQRGPPRRLTAAPATPRMTALTRSAVAQGDRWAIPAASRSGRT